MQARFTGSSVNSDSNNCARFARETKRISISACEKILVISVMIYEVEADLVPLLQHLMLAMQPYARAHAVRIKFQSSFQHVPVSYDAAKLISALSGLCCNLMKFLSAESEIQLRLEKVDEVIQIVVQNNSVDLSTVAEVVDNWSAEFSVRSTACGSAFTYSIRSYQTTTAPVERRNGNSINQVPGFYALIRERLRSHFTKSENLVALLQNNHPREAEFLRRVNEAIATNLHDERFDTGALCKALHLSRTQLFRRLKPLIRQAPAKYLRLIRLEKAKRLLETTDHTIAEVSFETGFISQSHFTKIFTQHYGVCPSLFRRAKMEQTDKNLIQTG